MHLPSQDRHWPGLKEVPADWPLLPAASPGPWGDFGGGGSDIPRLQCPHWGSCSCWASPRLGASLLPSGAMLSFPPGPWRGPLCPCLEVRAVPQPSPPREEVPASSVSWGFGPSSQEVGRCLYRGACFCLRSLPYRQRGRLGWPWPWFLWRELACGVEGCSQLLAADLCKYGLLNLAPILPSLSLLPTPEQTGH